MASPLRSIGGNDRSRHSREGGNDLVIPAKAGTQGAPVCARRAQFPQALGPRLRGDDVGQKSVLEGLRRGSVVIDCSTAIPSSTLRMAQAVEAAGSRFLDAPMTRTPKEAAEGRLNLLVGGDAALLEECRPLLQCFAENITHVGAVGAGHGMKLLHNYVSLGMVALLAEAAACAGRSGVAAETFVDVLARGGGGGIALERLKPSCWRAIRRGCAFRWRMRARTWITTTRWRATLARTRRSRRPCSRRWSRRWRAVERRRWCPNSSRCWLAKRRGTRERVPPGFGFALTAGLRGSVATDGERRDVRERHAFASRHLLTTRSTRSGPPSTCSARFSLA